MHRDCGAFTAVVSLLSKGILIVLLSRMIFFGEIT